MVYTIDSVNVLWLKALYPVSCILSCRCHGHWFCDLYFSLCVHTVFWFYSSWVPSWFDLVLFSGSVFLYQGCDKNAGLLVCAFCYANAKANSWMFPVPNQSLLAVGVTWRSHSGGYRCGEIGAVDSRLPHYSCHWSFPEPQTVATLTTPDAPVTGNTWVMKFSSHHDLHACNLLKLLKKLAEVSADKMTRDLQHWFMKQHQNEQWFGDKSWTRLHTVDS